MSKKGYKQSKEHKNKINTPERAKKISETLKLLYKTGKRKCWIKGRKLSEEHKRKIADKSIFKNGSKNPSWRGNKVGYHGIHLWIKNRFGKASKCINRENGILGYVCSKKSNNYQWAKIKGRRYSRKLEDYYPLCISCHSKYDSPKRKIVKCKVYGCKIKRRRWGYCDKHSQSIKIIK